MNNNDNSSLQMHSFNKIIAKKCGILSAVIYNHIEFWIQKNEANEKHFYDGKYWTYSTLTGMQKIFDYATVKQIRLAIDKLIKAGLIETGNYNKTPYDRTLWYSIKGKIDLPKKANGNSQKGTPIPDILTDELTDIYTQSKDCVYSDTPEKSISETEESSVDKKKAPPKHKHGEYKNVLLTDGDLEKLKQKFPRTYEEKIQRLSEGKEMRGYKYKNDYLAILKWAERDGYEEERESQPVRLSELEAYITPEGERRFRRKGAQ